MAVAETVSAEASLNLGVQALEAFNSGEWSTALELARKQIGELSCSPSIKAEMHHIEAACLYQMGQLEEAETAIRAAVAIEPAKENYLNTYGVILRKNKRIAEAVRSYELVMKLQPNFADVYYNCGNALNELNRKHEAVERFERCLEINPITLRLIIIAPTLFGSKLISFEHYSQSAKLEFRIPTCIAIGISLAVEGVLGPCN